MVEKIKKIAIKTEGLIKYFGTPQMTFDNLREIAKKQKEYFEYLGPDNFIKLSIYIYSLKETKDFMPVFSQKFFPDSQKDHKNFSGVWYKVMTGGGATLLC
jgi:hypothetical protein